MKIVLTFELESFEEGADVGWRQMQAIKDLFEALEQMTENADLSEWKRSTEVNP